MRFGAYTRLIVYIRFVFLSLGVFLCSFTFTVSAQNESFFEGLFTDNYKVEFKLGTGAVITPVPEKYLSNINGVNLPIMKPGFAGLLLAKKAITRHVEMGYQFEYFQLNGEVEQRQSRYDLSTTALANNFLLIYNFKNLRDPRPKGNYFFYYKVGGISLKNVPRRIAEDGSIGAPIGDKGFLNNMAVGHGGGVGFNNQITDHLSITATVELNRTSDDAADVYRVDKLFFHSESSVNSYFTASAGICYTFNLFKPAGPGFTHTRSATSKKLEQQRTIRKSRIRLKPAFAPEPDSGRKRMY